MTPEELYNLMRIANAKKVKEFLTELYATDRPLFDFLAKMFHECRGYSGDGTENYFDY